MLVAFRRTLGACLLVSLSAWSPPCLAEEDAATRAAARKLAEDGVAALQAGDAATATQKLDKAFRTLQVPSIALWSARALVKRGLLVEAAERYREATRLPVSGDAGVQEQAKADAQNELDQLQPRIPNLVVSVEGASAADVAVTLDGRGMPASLLGEDRPVNPGPHRVVARSAGDEQTAEVTIAEGERKPITLRFSGGSTTQPLSGGEQTALPAGPPSSGDGSGRRTLAFVALAAGGAGLVLGGVTGALAMSKKSALEDDKTNCDGDVCTHAVEDQVQSLRTFRTVSTIGFIAGGALAATGVVLLLTSPRSEQAGRASGSSVALGVGPLNLQLTGRF